jgi:hypothetical protein
MAKRNRIVSLLALPFVASIWFVGWVLYCVNSPKRNFKRVGVKQRSPVTTLSSPRINFMLVQPKEKGSSRTLERLRA